MQFIVKEIEKQEVEKMEKSFSKEFLESIKPPYYNQKLFKFFTYKITFNIDDEKLLLKVDAEHYYEWQYVSTSYTWDYIFLAISDKKVGIDIENIKERSSEMIDFFPETDYSYLGEKSRENFFVLRTAEECLIKTSNACFFEDWKNVKIKSLEKKEQDISWIQFSWESIMILHGKDYRVYTWKSDNKIYSIWIAAEEN